MNRWKLGSAVVLTAALAMADHVVNDNSWFELDGDIANNPASAGTDWQTVNQGPVPAPAVRTGAVADAPNGTIFTGGGSKDTNGIRQWLHTSGSVPDKDNIVNAYAYARVVDNELVIAFGADRYTTEGQANFGFWFFQSNVSLITTGPDAGKFSGVHTTGDLFLVSGYEQGGKKPVFKVYKWVGTDQNGSLQLVTDVQGNVHCGDPGTLYACADTNDFPLEIGAANSYSPEWNYGDKDGNVQVIPANAFFEGGLNVSHFYEAGGVPCFTTFMVETRSSTSETAQLKDFVLGSFPICGLTVSKSCGPTEIVASGTQIKYKFEGTVTNTGIGSLYNVKVIDTPTGAAAPIEIQIGTLAPGAVSWSAYYTMANLSVANYVKATGTVDTSQTSQLIESDVVGPVTCTAEVNVSLGISKSCSASLVAQGSNVVVRVDFLGSVTNNSNVAVSGLQLIDTPAATSLSLVTTALGPGESTTYAGSYYPSSISSGTGTEPGRYWFEDMIKVTGATPALGTLPDVAACGPGVKACKTTTCPICPNGLCAAP